MRNSPSLHWVLTGAGLMLLMSPFLLLDHTAPSERQATASSAVLMGTGLMLLLIPAVVSRERETLQALLGLIVALGIILMPEFMGLVGLAEWSLRTLGFVSASAALWELMKAVSPRATTKKRKGG